MQREPQQETLENMRNRPLRKRRTSFGTGDRLIEKRDNSQQFGDYGRIQKDHCRIPYSSWAQRPREKSKVSIIILMLLCNFIGSLFHGCHNFGIKMAALVDGPIFPSQRRCESCTFVLVNYLTTTFTNDRERLSGQPYSSSRNAIPYIHNAIIRG